MAEKEKELEQKAGYNQHATPPWNRLPKALPRLRTVNCILSLNAATDNAVVDVQLDIADFEHEDYL